MTLNGKFETGARDQTVTRDLGGLSELEDALRVRICSVCVDRNPDGACHLELENECALFHSFPHIVEAVSNVHSNLMEEYVAAIRKSVCEQCVHQDKDGFCRVRGEVRCVLDRYLLLIVQTIEEVRGIPLQPVARLPHMPLSSEAGKLQQKSDWEASSGVRRRSDA